MEGEKAFGISFTRVKVEQEMRRMHRLFMLTLLSYKKGFLLALLDALRCLTSFSCLFYWQNKEKAYSNMEL